MTFRYRVDEQTMMPVSGIVGAMRLEATGPRSVYPTLGGSTSYPTRAYPVDALREQIVELYAIGAQGLEQAATATGSTY